MLFATLFLINSCLAQDAAKIKSALYVSDPLPALEPQLHGTFEPAAGVIADRVTYATQYGMRIPAIVYHPKQSGANRPAFIVVNGHGGDKYSWYPYWTGVAFARMGAVVLTYDPIGEGERHIGHKSGTRAHDRYVPPPEMGRRMGGFMITDISQAVSYLSQRADVDPKRIAAGGYSMGSFVLALACAVETRLKACVLVGGGNLDGPDGYWDSSSKQMCQSIPYKSLQFLGDRPAAIFALHAQHAATFIYNGSADETVDIPHHGEDFFRDMRDRTIKKVGDASKVFEYAFSEGTGHRPYWVTKPVVEWLHKQLRFPDWKTPELTHIGEWAKANNIAMDKLYATEHREGGAMAVGRNVPPIDREALNVLPENEWTIHKDRFILEKWLEITKTKLVESPQ